MSTVQDYFDNALLALAAYANLDKSMDRTQLVDSLTPSDGSIMSASEADQFTAKYQVVDSQPDTPEGFSAILLKQGDQYTLAIRGTTKINGVRLD